VRNTLLTLVVALGLAACAIPRERCIAHVSADLRALDILIAETEGNIARGYAIGAQTETRNVVELCDWPNVPVLFCTQQQVFSRDQVRAIDTEQEIRKLATLQNRRMVAEQRTIVAEQMCSAPPPQPS
jgi:hypothetical protein